MNNNIKKFIKQTISDLIKSTSNNEKIDKLSLRHKKKIHFIPIRYRIFGGLLQSMNINFGNFVEKLLHKIIKSEKDLTINKNSSKKIILPITQRSSDLIDTHITDCQTENFDEEELVNKFNSLLDMCLKFEENTQEKTVNNTQKHDIDVLFSVKNDKVYYLEIKYNDDHDTGKYEEINRRFLKSYIGISNIIKVYDREKFKPIIYYLTQKKLKGNIYTPEKENIYRGKKLFEEFFTVKYSDLDDFLNKIGDDKDIIELFDNLYNKVRKDLSL